MGTTTLSTTWFQCTGDAEASRAPTSPPMRACDDDDGRPKYQVIRFQAIAPNRAATTTTRPQLPAATDRMSLTVLATFWPRNAPTKFITAAITSATRGVRARVE